MSDSLFSSFRAKSHKVISSAQGNDFRTWKDVLARAKSGDPLYYKAPMDYRASRIYLLSAGDSPRAFSYRVQARTIRIWPPGSSQRGRQRTRDPFNADAGHLDRFRRSP
jgi:hypothetical protein